MSNKIKCSHILVQKQSEALAIIERIKKGEKFGKLAKETSIDSGSAKRDGSFIWKSMSSTQMRPLK